MKLQLVRNPSCAASESAFAFVAKSDRIFGVRYVESCLYCEDGRKVDFEDVEEGLEGGWYCGKLHKYDASRRYGYSYYQSAAVAPDLTESIPLAERPDKETVDAIFDALKENGGFVPLDEIYSFVGDDASLRDIVDRALYAAWKIGLVERAAPEGVDAENAPSFYRWKGEKEVGDVA